MPLLRLSLIAIALGVFASGCTGCARNPVQNTLKAEGEACEEDRECESSLCDKLPGKAMVCFRRCSVGCNAGDVCTPLAVNDRFACVPERPGLCQSCSLNVDCPYPGDKCIEIGGNKVCARDCSFDGVCPSSYRCADATDTNGEYVTKQCQPVSGTCECTAATAGQQKPCGESNSFGTCMGVQTCKPPNGYDACSAHVPTSETCNGRDDDCNGQTDENLGDTTCGVGECRRTVANCANGAPQTCIAGSPNTEICDDKDNDCDGMTDEGFDKQTSLEHCGACNNPCIRANATAVCGAGMCSIGMCNPGWTNADGIDLNGCEYPCTPTGPEVCDGVDNDCNGQVDEGFQLATDPTNCGVCGRVCNVNNGNVMTYACVAGQCAIATCNAGYQDCDQTYASGCEQNTQTDVNNCGVCNTRCMTANGTPTCTGGTCGIGSCNAPWDNCDNNASNGCETNTNTSLSHCGTCGNACPTRNNAQATCNGSCGFTCNPGFTDLDGNPANGCEYACIPTGVDDPDDDATDTNCDGIDGDASRAIFVHPMGDDSAAGTRTAPKRTVQAGINAANTTTRPHVYVAQGVYTEPVTLRNGISVYGGFNATTWSRAGAFTTTLRSNTVNSGAIIAVQGSNLSLPTTLAYLTIRAMDTTTPGVSTYGVHCVTCTALTMRQLLITGGAAGPGTAGNPGVAGAAGFPGTAGSPGTCDANEDGAPGGPGGVSSCGRTGGAGGRGGRYGSNAGQMGSSGVGGTLGGAGGAGGNPGRTGLVGGTGSPGAPGNNGSGGSGVFVVGNLLSAGGGTSGDTGSGGNGGGGGGGGGGQGCTFCNDGNGNGGGGGGAGGCGGTSGSGGSGGGSSIAVFLSNSTGARIENCDLTSGNGGIGGAGGAGGNGGGGGSGATGGTVCTGEVGAGGWGGPGGAGGRGGHGGGGAGGISYALYKVLTVPVVVNVTYAHGSAGGGGPSSGNSGSAGTAGDTN